MYWARLFDQLRQYPLWVDFFYSDNLLVASSYLLFLCCVIISWHITIAAAVQSVAQIGSLIAKLPFPAWAKARAHNSRVSYFTSASTFNKVALVSLIWQFLTDEMTRRPRAKAFLCHVFSCEEIDQYVLCNRCGALVYPYATYGSLTEHTAKVCFKISNFANNKIEKCLCEMDLTWM